VPEMAAIKQEQTTLGAFDLLSRFISLRENGANRDDAWYQVCDSVGDINDVTRKAFLSLAKNWERREGHKYRYSSPNKKHDTLTQNELKQVTEKVQEHQQVQEKERQRSQPQPPPPPRKQPKPPGYRDDALTGTLDPARLREHQQQRLDQILDQLDDLPEGDEGEAYPPQTQPQTATGRTAPMRYPRDFFGPRTVLLMCFKNYPNPLRVTIAGEDELFIGRATSNAAMSPEIDLSAVNAANFGVSRMHAAITRRNNQLLICDLESMNYTHVNGMRLLPNEVRILQDGDEIWFGQLRCQIRFQQG
jgi:hypothetical protein